MHKHAAGEMTPCHSSRGSSEDWALVKQRAPCLCRGLPGDLGQNPVRGPQPSRGPSPWMGQVEQGETSPTRCLNTGKGSNGCEHVLMPPGTISPVLHNISLGCTISHDIDRRFEYRRIWTHYLNIAQISETDF